MTPGEEPSHLNERSDYDHEGTEAAGVRIP